MVLYKLPRFPGLEVHHRKKQRNLAQLVRGRTTISSIVDLVKIQFWEFR
jgi:hypothetical protein